MKRILLSLMVFLMTILVASSLADPMALDDDLTGTFRFPYDDMDPDAGAYVYTYRYPHIAGSDPDASCVNLFFADLLETLETNLQFTAEGYAESGKSVNVDVDYKITCNNSQFFSLVLIRTVTSGMKRIRKRRESSVPRTSIGGRLPVQPVGIHPSTTPILPPNEIG